ncbi:hypothetical protein BDZ89DRAFT_1011338 [Hymenopellis radicata]|nr:hypothetical protein BDZ89DRAFT_1011338 [Hymenopellis radicata]
MLFKFRRQWEAPWEVVDSKTVSPVCMYYDDEDTLDIVAVSDTDTRGTYVFDVKNLNRTALRNAVVFSRQQLIQEIEKKDFNILMLESWRLTIFRRGKSHRVEVQYAGKGAQALGKLPHLPPPPFMDVLQEVL